MGARRTLVIGIGHPDRGDDAVGRIFAARLAGRAPEGVTVLDIDGEAARLLDLFDGADDVIVVDAAVSGAKPGTIHRLDAVAGALPPAMFGMSTHAMGLADSIELARALGQLPKRCIVFAVEGSAFELGETLSPLVERAVDDVVLRVLDELRAELV
jgi:hydrogenase maturation protease